MTLAKKKLLVAAALAVLTMAIFAPVLTHDFVNYDDPVYVTKARFIQKGITWENFQHAFTQAHASFWHPLTTLSHMLDCQLFGLNPAGHHAESVLWHTGSVVLLFLVLLQMTGAIWRSAIVAAFFAWHPLHVESVAWVAEKKDVLSTFFWMLTMWAYVRYAESSSPAKTEKKNAPASPTKGREVWRYLLTLFCFVLGLMAKPMLVTLPFVFLLMDFWPLQRVQGEKWRLMLDRGSSIASTGRFGLHTLKRLILEKIPFLVLAVVFMFVAIEAQKHGNTIMSSDRVPYLARFENAAISYLIYLWKTIWPAGLMPFYPYRGDLSLVTSGIAALVVIAVTVLAFVYARRFPFLTLGWLWYAGTLVPVSGLIQVGSHAMADRYTYVPLVGVFIVLAWGATEWAARRRLNHLVLGTLSAVALAICAVLTSVQLSYWKNSGTLFEHTLAVSEQNAVAHVQLAGHALMSGDVPKAELHTRRALEMFPNNRIAHRMLGLVYESQKNWPEAAREFSITLEATPEDVEALYGYANALFHLGKNEESIRTYHRVMQLMPDDAPPHNNVGNVYMAEGRMNEAIAEYAEAVRRKPDYSDARFNLAVAYVRTEKYAEAVPHLAEILKQFPNDANAHYLMGLAASRSGSATEALAHFQECIRLAPDQPAAITAAAECAFILACHPDASVRQESEALHLAERAGEASQFQEPWILTVLARCYAATGNFDKAIVTAEKAKSLEAGKRMSEDVDKDLALYRQHQPYRNSTWARQ